MTKVIENQIIWMDEKKCENLSWGLVLRQERCDKQCLMLVSVYENMLNHLVEKDLCKIMSETSKAPITTFLRLFEGKCMI